MANLEHIAPKITDSKDIVINGIRIIGTKHDNTRELTKYIKGESNFINIKDFRGRFNSFEDGIKKMKELDKDVFEGN